MVLECCVKAVGMLPQCCSSAVWTLELLAGVLLESCWNSAGLLLDVASGQQSKSEAQGLGDYEFVPWQIGATM